MKTQSNFHGNTSLWLKKKVTFEFRNEKKISNKVRCLGFGFGLGTGLVLVFLGIPLPIYLLAIMIPMLSGLHLGQYRDTVAYIILACIPLVLTDLFASLYTYNKGVATLRGTCSEIGRPEQRCFDSEYHIYREEREKKSVSRLDEWSEDLILAIKFQSLKMIFRYYGPMKNMYKGPVLGRNVAWSHIESNGEQIDVNELIKVLYAESRSGDYANICPMLDHRNRMQGNVLSRGNMDFAQTSLKVNICLADLFGSDIQFFKYIFEDSLLVFGIRPAESNEMLIRYGYYFETIVLFDNSNGRLIDRYVFYRNP